MASTATTGSKSLVSPRVTAVPRPERFPSFDPSAPKKTSQSPFSSPKKIHPSLLGTTPTHEQVIPKQTWHISMVPRYPPSLPTSKSTEKTKEKLSSKSSNASVASHSDIDLMNKKTESKKEALPNNDLPTKSIDESPKTTKNLCSTTSTFVKILWILLIGAILLTVAALLIIFLTRSNSTTSTTSTTTVRLITYSVNRSNMIFNGDAEIGSCENGSNITSPTGWNVNGTATQIAYNNSANIGQTFEMPGPSNRGNCYFYGQQTASTTMWQTINLTNYADTTLIDAQVVKFNLSAWFGGFGDQNDTAIVSLAFINQTNSLILSGNAIGNMLAADRNNATAMFYRSIIGFIPAGARIVTVIVTMIRWSGTVLNCNVDNIALNLFL